MLRDAIVAEYPYFSDENLSMACLNLRRSFCFDAAQCQMSLAQITRYGLVFVAAWSGSAALDAALLGSVAEPELWYSAWSVGAGVFGAIAAMTFDARRADQSWSGPVNRLRRGLQQLSAGESGVSLAFRAGDACPAVAHDFNALVERVDQLTLERDRALEQAARQTGKSWTYAEPSTACAQEPVPV